MKSRRERESRRRSEAGVGGGQACPSTSTERELRGPLPSAPAAGALLVTQPIGSGRAVSRGKGDSGESCRLRERSDEEFATASALKQYVGDVDERAESRREAEQKRIIADLEVRSRGLARNPSHAGSWRGGAT